MRSIQQLRKTVARLRSPNGCPWDRQQTHQSLAECLVEECSELLEAIDRHDLEHMREELGDVLLQVVMHAQLAEEANVFDLEAVAAEVNEKLIRRHPHVFAEDPVEEPEAALARWDQIKATEKNNLTDPERIFKNLPARLPALLFAKNVYKQLCKGQHNSNGTLDDNKLQALSKELDEEKAGAMLFEIVAACRPAKIDPESALRRFVTRLMEKIENHENGLT